MAAEPIPIHFWRKLDVHPPRDIEWFFSLQASAHSSIIAFPSKSTGRLSKVNVNLQVNVEVRTLKRERHQAKVSRRVRSGGVWIGGGPGFTSMTSVGAWFQMMLGLYFKLVAFLQ